MGLRIKEHSRALISADAPYSAVAEHAMKTGHEIAGKEQWVWISTAMTDRE